MSNRKKALQEDQDQSVVINKDAEFENQSVDPRFVFDETHKDMNDLDDQPESSGLPDEQDEQAAERGAEGLGELDGTNPGSSHHSQDS